MLPAISNADRLSARSTPGLNPPAASLAAPTFAGDHMAISGGGGTTWTRGRPLSEAQNAHKTNTREDFAHAMKDGSNWFEGDIRTEINPPYEIEMRHDKGHETGDNLTLHEWLTMGKESGRGLKLDVKEGPRIGEMLTMIEEIDVPAERLMFNLGDGDMAKWGPEIRRRFPDAILAINPTTSRGGQTNEGPLESWQVERMIALEKAAGGPATFVVRYDLLTDAAIKRLKDYGTVSVWNAPSQGGVDDPVVVANSLRARGVNGVVDIRKSMGWREKAGTAVDWGLNQGKSLTEKGEGLLKDGLKKLGGLFG